MFEQFMTMTEAEIRAAVAAAYGPNPDEEGRTIDENFTGWVSYMRGMHPKATGQQIIAEVGATLMSFLEDAE